MLLTTRVYSKCRFHYKDFEALAILPLECCLFLLFIVIPIIVNISNDVIANRGENITLQCHGSANTPHNVTWETPSGQILCNFDAQTSDYEITMQGLTVIDVDADDGGYYTCIVANKAGNTSATVEVYITPYFRIHPPNIYATNGSYTNVTCVAEAFPAPMVFWMASIGSATETGMDLGLESGQGINEDQVTATEAILVFEPIIFQDENGNYVCNATNDYGEAIATINVTRKLLVTVAMNSSFRQLCYVF